MTLIAAGRARGDQPGQPAVAGAALTPRCSITCCARRRAPALSRPAAGPARVLKAEGAKSLMLFVLSRNEQARGFYERLGGEAFAEVASKGWGEGLTETAYRWKDIGAMAG